MMVARADVLWRGTHHFPDRFLARDPRVDVRDFGAVGDGSTDSTEAFRRAAGEAASRGLPMYVPTGVWVVRGRITVTPTAVDPYGSPSFVVFGDGPGMTTILIDSFAGFTPPDALFDVTATGAAFEIRDLTISTNFLTPPDAGLHLVRMPGNNPGLYLRDVNIFGDNGTTTNVSAVLNCPTAGAQPSMAVVCSHDQNLYGFLMWPRLFFGNPNAVSALLVNVFAFHQPIAFGPVPSGPDAGEPFMMNRLECVACAFDGLDVQSALTTPTIWFSACEFAPTGLKVRSGTALVDACRIRNLTVATETTTPARVHVGSSYIEGTITLSSAAGGDVLVVVGDSTITMSSAPSVGSGATLAVANCRYEGPAPTGTGTFLRDGWLTVQTTWDPPALGAGEFAATTVSVPGASVGAAAVAAHSGITQSGVVLSAAVTSAGTVTVTLYNLTGTTLDVPSGTLTVMVRSNP